MAADYWSSTQRLHWTLSRRELAEKRRKLEDEERSLIQQFPLPERRLFHLHLYQRASSSVPSVMHGASAGAV